LLIVQVLYEKRINCLSHDNWAADNEVALEFGALLSLLVREPLIPLGTRRVDGKPVKWEQVFRPPFKRDIPPKGVDSKDLREVLCGLCRASPETADAVLAAAKLYFAALSFATYDISVAYFTLVSAIESLSGHYLKDRKFVFDEVEKFTKACGIIERICSVLKCTKLTDDLKTELLRSEHFGNRG
jgi:hypothetical protein